MPVVSAVAELKRGKAVKSNPLPSHRSQSTGCYSQQRKAGRVSFFKVILQSVHTLATKNYVKKTTNTCQLLHIASLNVVLWEKVDFHTDSITEAILKYMNSIEGLEILKRCEVLYTLGLIPAVNQRWWPDISAHRSADEARPRPHWAVEAPARTMTAWGSACCTAAGKPRPGWLEPPEKGRRESESYCWLLLDQPYRIWIMHHVCTARLQLFHVVFLREENVNLSVVIFYGVWKHFWIHEIKWIWGCEIKYFIMKCTLKQFNCIIYQKGVGLCQKEDLMKLLLHKAESAAGK